MKKVKNNITFFFVLLSINEQKFSPILIISEINRQILRAVESLKISMNCLISLNREIIERLDTLEKNESFKVQSVLDEHNTLVGVFPIETAANLKEAESQIENNSAFKGKLVSFIFKYYFIN